MLQRCSLSLLLLLAACDAAQGASPPPKPAQAGPVPWSIQPSSWRTDPAWYDGQAEKCTYRASREIYGLPREYVAIAYTNKQRMDEGTTTKATSDAGVEVFKHHWSERVPTENYDYDFSTATFTRSADLTPFKLTAATQEDCGASFKQVCSNRGRLEWLESIYHPGGGIAHGELEAQGVQFEDALSLVLRDFPFASAAPGARYELLLIPSQKNPRRVRMQPAAQTLVYHGEETLDLPIGRLRTQRLSVSARNAAGSAPGATYWFAAEGAAPWLHALVRYEDGDNRYELESLERTAYWER